MTGPIEHLIADIDSIGDEVLADEDNAAQLLANDLFAAACADEGAP